MISLFFFPKPVQRNPNTRVRRIGAHPATKSRDTAEKVISPLAYGKVKKEKIVSALKNTAKRSGWKATNANAEKVLQKKPAFDAKTQFEAKERVREPTPRSPEGGAPKPVVTSLATATSAATSTCSSTAATVKKTGFRQTTENAITSARPKVPPLNLTPDSQKGSNRRGILKSLEVAEAGAVEEEKSVVAPRRHTAVKEQVQKFEKTLQVGDSSNSKTPVVFENHHTQKDTAVVSRSNVSAMKSKMEKIVAAQQVGDSSQKMLGAKNAPVSQKQVNKVWKMLTPSEELKKSSSKEASAKPLNLRSMKKESELSEEQIGDQLLTEEDQAELIKIADMLLKLEQTTSEKKAVPARRSSRSASPVAKKAVL